LIAASGFFAACAHRPGRAPTASARSRRFRSRLLRSRRAARARERRHARLRRGAASRALELGLDPLSAVFLLPVAILSAACGCYSLAYFGAGEHREALPA
jgi:hypothetical protein